MVVVGHSMGGRVALHLSTEPDVVGVAALAPWVESDVRQPRPGVAVLLMHGSSDHVTDPRRTDVLARRYADSGVDLRYVQVRGRHAHDAQGRLAVARHRRRLRHGRADRPRPNQLITPPAASSPAHHSIAAR